jgi:hypothetical protein
MLAVSQSQWPELQIKLTGVNVMMTHFGKNWRQERFRFNYYIRAYERVYICTQYLFQ